MAAQITSGLAALLNRLLTTQLACFLRYFASDRVSNSLLSEGMAWAAEQYRESEQESRQARASSLDTAFSSRGSSLRSKAQRIPMERGLKEGIKLRVTNAAQLQISIPIPASLMESESFQRLVKAKASNIEAALVLRGLIPALKSTTLGARLLERARKLQEQRPKDNALLSQRTQYLARCVKDFSQILLGDESEALVPSQLQLELFVSESGESFTFSAKKSPAVLKVEDYLEEIRKSLHAREAIRGASSDVKRLLKRARFSVKLYSRVYTLAGYGYPNKAIAKKLSLNPNTVKRWLSGAVPQRIERLSATRRPTKNASLRREVKLPRGESVEWASLLGAFAGSHSGGLNTATIRFGHQDEEVITELSSALAGIVPGLKPTRGVTEHKGKETFFCRGYSTALTEVLNGLTAFNQRLPWVALGTEAEKNAFLSSVLDFRGSVVGKRFAIRTKGNLRFLTELGTLMESVGITPALWEGPINTLAITGRDDLQRLLDLDLLRRSEQREKLQAVISNAPKRVSRTAAEYKQVMALHAEAPSMSYGEMQRQTGVPASTVSSWVNKKTKPDAIVRSEQLAGYKERLGVSSSVAAKLFRESELSTEAAIMLSVNRSYEDSRHALNLLAKTGIKESHLPSVPLIRWKRFAELFSELIAREENSDERATEDKRRYAVIGYANQVTKQRAESFSEACWLIVGEVLPRIRKLAATVALKNQASGLDEDDFTDVGCLGAIAALTRYNPELSPDFFAYGAKRIRGAMIDAVQGFGPVGQRAWSIAKQVRTGELPNSLTAIVEATNCHFDTAVEALSVVKGSLSLSQGGRSRDGEPEAIAVRDRKAEWEAEAHENNEAFESLLSPLAPCDRTLIDLVYRQGFSIEEASGHLELEENEAKQRHERALELMRCA